MERKENLNNFIVGDLPTLFYIPDFITDSEQAQLLNNIYQAPVSKWKSLKNRRLQNLGGVVHEKGLLTQDLPPWLSKITERIREESGLFPSAINHVLINEYLPNQGIMPHQDGPAYYPVVAILSLGSPVVMDFTPHSRLDSCRRTSTDDNGAEKHQPFSVLLMPRSLLIFKDDAYSGKLNVIGCFRLIVYGICLFTCSIIMTTDYLHGIEDNVVHQLVKVVNENEALSRSASRDAEVIRSEDTKVVNRTEGRISLTCRLVLKVHKNLFRF
ncbi:inactive serine/threonine-protein kinase [Hibiscus syriacus]|uniref:Inactive serine/threonine-protein kinase n=1 Tax=Hibiscus syriacus TaxID=106335 RepID=A0A6A2WH09_HIBSY|nr:inactive serine/threonine-protein kinase [Hibiscus syriacus]